MIGERIKRARTGAGLSLRDLADKSNLSAMAISKYERDQMTPTSGNLISLSRALGVKVEYFLRPRTVELGKIRFRKRVSLAKKQQHQIEADVLDQVERFLDLVDLFPQRPCEEFVLPTGLPCRIASLDAIEEVATKLRDAWHLGYDPIPNLSDTLEKQGILVMTTDVANDSKFDGLTAWVGEIPVIVVGVDWPGDRQRFTLSHELGHIVLHGCLSPEVNDERAANRFAGAFLAPEAAVKRALGPHRTRFEWPELLNLKQAFGLSAAGWYFRALDLGIIMETTFESFMRQRSAQGWRKREPGPQLPSESPRLFRNLVFRALAEEMISESKAAELSGVSTSEFRTEWSAEVSGDAAHQ